MLNQMRMRLLRRHVRFQYAGGFGLTKQSPLATDINHFLNPVAPYLILNGDIGDPEAKATKRFLTLCALHYDIVWWVPGYKELEHETHTADVQLDKMFSLAHKIGPQITVGCQSEFHIRGQDILVLASPMFRNHKTFSGPDEEWLTEALSFVERDTKIVLATYTHRPDIQDDTINVRSFSAPLTGQVKHDYARLYGNNWLGKSYNKQAFFEVGDDGPYPQWSSSGGNNTLREVYLA